MTALYSQNKSEDDNKTEALSVSAAMALAKSSLEAVVVSIIGEVSEVSVKPGYKAAYFSVKDNSSSLPCMMWNNRYKEAGFDLEVGQLVQITGRFSLYAAKGRMNFEVFALSLAGEGDLRLKVANLAKKLKAEGLMEPARKKPLPLYPIRIGVVTSPRGAAVHDVLRTLRRRYPVAEVLLAGVPVEGPKAPEGLISALQCVENAGAEVILMVRGGGSFEDLMPFNDEALARAIAACSVPVVTGIGHEVDTSIADMVSDLRASTPTAAAETVTPSRENMETLFAARAASLEGSMLRRLEKTDAYLARIADKALFADPMMLFATEAQWLDQTAERLERALPERLSRIKDRLQGLHDRLGRLSTTMLERFRFSFGRDASRLADLSPLNTLARGYSFAKNDQGQILRHIDQVKVDSEIQVVLVDGSLMCSVVAIDDTTPFVSLEERENL